jgi:hypothetical protein
MANTTYAKACELGYPYIRGTPKIIDGMLANRFTRTDNPQSDAVYVGWSASKHTGRVIWHIEYEPGLSRMVGRQALYHIADHYNDAAKSRDIGVTVLCDITGYTMQSADECPLLFVRYIRALNGQSLGTRGGWKRLADLVFGW